MDGPLSVSGHKPRKQLFLERDAFANQPSPSGLPSGIDMDALKSAFNDGLMSKVSDVVSVVKYSHAIGVSAFYLSLNLQNVAECCW